MIDDTKFQKLLQHLEAQYKNYLTIPQKNYLFEIDKEAITESVIQRFETCYDALWKVLKRYLNEELGIPELPNSPKPIFRIAAENNVLPTDAATWIRYADARIATSHDYSGDKAQETIALISDFIADANRLYLLMTN